MTPTLSPALLLAVPLLPLIGCLIAGFFGTALMGNRIGRSASHWVTILGVFFSFLLSCYVLWQVTQGARFDDTIYEWMVVGDFRMEVGFLVDGLTALMMVVVTSVSFLVHVYTIGYMDGDPGYNRFFSYISLFTFSMLMLCMSNNFLQLFFGWEAVGLVSYLLIGFWFQRPPSIFANLKAFMVNRVGDFGFIVGIALVYAYAGTVNYGEVFAQVDDLAGIILPGTGWMLMTTLCIFLFIGAMGKSAQFPLHVWLPDSMEGPTPISALIHAATMVTAGIFMVARMSPLFEGSDVALNFILVIGSITALFMGILGIVSNDIKKVIAYSTLSQLGYMTVALGVSAYSAAIFHLMTHAFFKALLFLGSGSVIIAMHHNKDMRWMGGLHKHMPITSITFLLATFALVAVPLFSGFYSKDAIIHASHASSLPAAGFASFAVTAGVFITAVYAFREYFLVFMGKPRWDQDPEVIAGRQEPYHPKESPKVVTVPLMILAVLSVGVGFFTMMPVLFGSLFDDSIFVNVLQHPAMTELREAIAGPGSMALDAFVGLPLYLMLAGVLVAWYCYIVNPGVPARIASTFKPVYDFLVEKYYMDWLWINVGAGAARLVGRGLYTAGDRGIIETGVVNASWRLVGWTASVTRWFQSGYLYHYALVMVLGVFVLMSYFIWLA